MEHGIIDVTGFQTNEEARERYKYSLIVGIKRRVYYTDSTSTVINLADRLREEKVELHIMVRCGFKFMGGEFIPKFIERSPENLWR